MIKFLAYFLLAVNSNRTQNLTWNLIDNQNTYTHSVLPVSMGEAVDSFLPFEHGIYAQIPEQIEGGPYSIFAIVPLGGGSKLIGYAREDQTDNPANPVTGCMGYSPFPALKENTHVTDLMMGVFINSSTAAALSRCHLVNLGV